MARRGITAGTLAILTLAALLSPLAAAQAIGGAAASSAPPPGSISVRTSALAYPAGQPVGFTVQNNDTTAPFHVSGTRLHLFVQGAERADFPLPLNASLNATLANDTWLPPGGALNLTWDAAGAPPGDYIGSLESPASGSWAWVAYVNNGTSFSLLAPARPGSLQLSTPGSSPSGQPVTFIVTNQGPGALASAPCSVRLAVRDAGSDAPVADVALPAPCSLAPGASAMVTWDARDASGQPVPAGAYAARVEYGGVSADAAFRVQAASGEAGTREAGTRSLSLRVSSGAAVGEPVHVLLVNTGTLDLQGALAVRVRDARGALVFARDDNVTLTLPANRTFDFVWDARDDAGQPVGPGTFTVEARFAGLLASAAVSLGQAPGPAPAGAPAPPGGASVLGGFAMPPAGGAWTNFTGQFVSFQQAPGSGIRGLQVGGAPVLDLAYSDPSRPELGPGFVRLGGVTVYDAVYPALRAVSPGGAAQWTVAFAPGLQVRVLGDQATFDGPGVHGVLVTTGPARVTGPDPGTNRVAVAFDNAPGESPGFVVRVTPGVQAAGAPYADALPRAIAGSKVAAEAYIAPGAQPEVSVVPYVAQARVQVLGASPAALRLRVDVDEPRGRVLVFHLGQGVLGADAQHVAVRFDGEAIAQADNISDVLNPDDDGLHAEYAVVSAAQGLDVLVSVPHFSPHDVTIESTAAQVVRSLAPYGIAAGFALALAAGAAMLRRRP